MALQVINFNQINLQHCKAATANICRNIAMGDTHIVLIQEPWENNRKIMGFGVYKNRIFSADCQGRKRSAIYVVPGLKAMLLRQFSDEDTTVVRIFRPVSFGGDLLVASCYMPGTAVLPYTDLLTEAVKFSKDKGVPMILGCDANSHHTVWGSTDINPRGNLLLQFIADAELDILNRGNVPTFVTKNRKEVLDVTLASESISNQIDSWKVSLEPSFSDHRCITFTLRGCAPRLVRFRNPRRTNWEQYRNFLRQHMEDRLESVLPKSSRELNEAVDSITLLLTRAYEDSCPETTSLRKKGGKLWNAEVEKLRLRARKSWNKAMRTAQDSDWAFYRAYQKAFRKAVVWRARETWKRFCAEMEQVPDYARIHKILAKDTRLLPSSLRRPDGNFTECGETTAKHLLETHFPDCSEDKHELRPPDPTPPLEEDWRLAKRIVTVDRLRWAIGKFESFKSAGDDGIFPALLKESGEILLEPLCEVMRSSLALGHIPAKWEKVKVTFIPKPGKPSHATAKDFRPISLTSFIMKALERLIEVYIREEALIGFPLHANQHAYQVGKSTDSALHCLVSKIEKSFEFGEVALGCFMDIEGAFDNTGFEVIRKALVERGVAPLVVRWICSMLRNRAVEADVCGCKTNFWVAKGCPQGGILSPLLWSLVVDSLISELNGKGFFAQGYSDDLTIMIRGKFESTLGDRMRTAVKTVEDWCQRNGLSINPKKTELVLFSRRRTGSHLVGKLRLFGDDVELSSQVKYLGVILDSKLNWIAHVSDKAQKAMTAFWICRNSFGRNWGLPSKAILWIYETVIRPMMCHGCVVWWPRLNIETARKAMMEVQRLVCICVTGAMKTTATAAMETLLCVPPVDLIVKAKAFATADRLAQNGLWTPNFRSGHGKILNLISDPIFAMPRDRIKPELNFVMNFRTIIPERQAWLNGWPDGLPDSQLMMFTDGSKTAEGSGSGVFTLETETGYWRALGKLASVFQAETFAVLLGASETLPRDAVGQDVCIFSDSESMIKALMSPVVTSKLVKECKEYLNEVGQTNKITIVWVPGHSGVEGNELADEMARTGSSSLACGPDPQIPIPQSLCVRALKDWVKVKHAERWGEYEGGRHTKSFFPKPNDKWSKELVSMDRSRIARVVGAITGHCGLNRHLRKMRLSDTSECTCGLEEETGIHVICDCPKFLQLRRKVLGGYTVTPSEVLELGPVILDRFLAKTGRLA